MVTSHPMISIDIDLNIMTPRGSVSVDHADEDTLRILISDSAALRDLIQIYPTLQRLQKSVIGKKLQQGYVFDVQVASSSVMKVTNGKLYVQSKLYVLWQYLLAQFGI